MGCQCTHHQGSFAALTILITFGLSALGGAHAQVRVPSWEPSCPINMDRVLPAADYWGALPCGNGKEPCQNLKGKVALITGASTGIGRGAADRLAAAGMKVIGTSRNPEQYNLACTYNMPGDRCKPVGWELWQMDQTSEDSVRQLINRVRSTNGRIDFLFLNAGRGYNAPTFLPADPKSGYYCNGVGQMERVMQTNFFGTLRVMLAALPLMPKSGYAHILTTSSVMAFVSFPGFLPYTASKMSLEAIAEEWLWEHYGSKAGNIKYSTLYPNNVRSDVARKSIGCDSDSVPASSYLVTERHSWQNPSGNPLVTAAEAGEAVYRIAIDPTPASRYLLNPPRSLEAVRRRICTQLAHPLEDWPLAFRT